MDVDRNLFAYDFAIVSMMKNASPYVKEWLDYHLLAGVDHFFIYDNDSEDNFAEIVQPYVDAGLVTYKFYPGKRIMMKAFNEAIDEYKYLCRYIAFIDDDEFIFPQDNLNVTEVTDEILFDERIMGGLEISWMVYGSNGHQTADLNRGVLERFKRRESKVNAGVKSIVNPRRVDFMWTPHFAVYFDAFAGVKQSDIDALPNVDFKIADKIVLNHYWLKSLEEYIRRKSSTDANFGDAWKNLEEKFYRDDVGLNEVFDDSILKYRYARQVELVPNGDIIKTFSALNKINFDKIFKALTYNLLPLDFGDDKNFFANIHNQLKYFRAVSEFYKTAPPEFFQGRLVEFFTCWGVSNFLKENYLDVDLARNFEKTSLNAIVRTLQAGTSLTDLQFLMKEIPKLLALPYAVVNTIRQICIEMISEWEIFLRNSIKSPEHLQRWKDILEWDNWLKVLKTFDNYRHNQWR